MGENGWEMGGKIDPTRDGRVPSPRYGSMRGFQIFQGFLGDLQVFSGSNDSQCLRPLDLLTGLAALDFFIGEEVQECGSLMNLGSESYAQELALGNMSHEDNIVVTQELALGKVSHEDNIVMTQELALGKMFHEDNIVATQEVAWGKMFHEDNIAVTK